MLLFNVYLIASLPAGIGAYLLWFDTSRPVNLLFIPLLYLASLLAFSLLHIIISCIGSLFVSGSQTVEKPTNLAFYMIHSICHLLTCLLGVRVKGFDLKQLPKGPYYLVCNHRSNFDPLITAPYMKDEKICYISKFENFKIPVAGKFMLRAGYIGIDRENPSKAMEAIVDSTARLRSGINVAVYPEGTRSKSDQLADFHSGVFIPARKAGVPVVVIAIKNTEKIARNVLRRITTVEIKLCGVIESEVVKATSTHKLASMSHQMISEALS